MDNDSRAGFTGNLARAVSEVRLNTKPAEPTNDRVQAWYPYYAGYSIEFAKGIIAATNQEEPLHILDPWNGSGTTTRAGILLGHQVSGLDINPVAILVSAAKMVHAEDARHVHGLVSRIAPSLKAHRARKTDPLLAWLPLGVVSRYRAIERTIIEELGTNAGGQVICPSDSPLPPLAAFLVLALMRAAKSLANVKYTSNPTWQRPSGAASASTGKQLAALWISTVQAMASDLNDTEYAPGRPGKLAVAQSTELPIAERSVDLILTSPPYCTRIDYFVGTAFDLAAVGISEDSARYKSMRQAAMGTNLSRNRAAAEIPADWPKSIQSLLASIRRHPSKASSSYYLKTYIQYFGDCLLSLGEMHRVLKTGGAAVVVVQTSYYKDIHVDLPQLYVDCGRSVGLQGKVTSSIEVTRALTQINSRSRRHLEDRGYRESVVVFEKRD